MKFSIGIPAFKSSFLKECIESVLLQTYNDFELVIVNDCSPEPVKEIVESFNDNRIRYFENIKNIGAENVVDNWNKCLDYSSGEYFILLGDDDKLLPNFLYEFNLLIDKFPDLNVYHCRSKVINENGKTVKYTNSWPERESVYENIWHRIMELRVQYVSDFLYKTSYLKSVGGYFKLPLAWASDDITSYKAMIEGGVAHTNIPLFCYRESSQTISSTGNRDIKMKAILSEEQWLNDFLKFEVSDISIIDSDFKEMISRNLKKFIQKKKVRTISRSFRGKLDLQMLVKWYRVSKQFEFSLVELLYAYLEYLKMNRAKTKY